MWCVRLLVLLSVVLGAVAGPCQPCRCMEGDTWAYCTNRHLVEVPMLDKRVANLIKTLSLQRNSIGYVDWSQVSQSYPNLKFIHLGQQREISCVTSMGALPVNVTIVGEFCPSTSTLGPVFPTMRRPPLFPAGRQTTLTPATTVSSTDTTEFTEFTDTTSDRETLVTEVEGLKPVVAFDKDNDGVGEDKALFDQFDEKEQEVAKILTDLERIIKNEFVQVASLIAGLLSCTILICFSCKCYIKIFKRCCRGSNSHGNSNLTDSIQVNEISSTNNDDDFSMELPPYPNVENYATTSSVMTETSFNPYYGKKVTFRPGQTDARSDSSDEIYLGKMKRK